MALPRTIVGIGEALLIDTPDGRQPGGLAIDVASEAARLGQNGYAVSRLGQDGFAEELLAALAETAVHTDHLQSDPDLPTGRRVTRAIGGRGHGERDPQSAYDNLQWDYDLTDLAQRSDVVVYGLLAGRFAQTRSVTQQFLGECGTALRVVDLTNRENHVDMDRGAAVSLMQMSDVAIVDETALRTVAPGPLSKGGSDEAAAWLTRQHDLALTLGCTAGNGTAAFRVYHGGEQWELAPAVAPEHLRTALVAFLYGAAVGHDAPTALSRAATVTAWSSSHPTEVVPGDVLRGTTG